jgi:peroxiredoxin
MRPLFSLLFTFLAFSVVAQTGYKIDCKINGLKDTTAYLGYYYKENTHVQDTAKVNSQGMFTFTGSKVLVQGMYFLILDKSIIFHLVVGSDQQFSLETSTTDYIKNMVVKGDDDNRLFFENMVYDAARDEEAKPLVAVMKDSAASKDQKTTAQESLKKIGEKVMAHRQAIIDKYPQAFTVRMMLVNKPIVIPDPPKKADGTIDSTFQLRYYRQHFFDNFNLGDEAMLRMPKVFYWEKVKEYLTRLHVQHPDSITRAIEGLVAVAKTNKETYKYLVWKCIGEYQQHEIMGLDEVYVNMVDKYIATGEMAYWLDAKTVKNQMDYASKVRLAMIGRTAPNLIMLNEDLQPRSLYDLKNKYSIIFFFKPTCGHCREEAPKLVEFYNANKKNLGLEIFAVSTDTSMKEMKAFIHELKTPWVTVNGPRSYINTHFSNLYFAESTPTLYILDERKKVIARKLGVENLASFFENYEKMIRRKG